LLFEAATSEGKQVFNFLKIKGKVISPGGAIGFQTMGKGRRLKRLWRRLSWLRVFQKWVWGMFLYTVFQDQSKLRLNF
jgi:hypothetical protein